MGGNMITPMSVFDVMDEVEECLGVEARQCLEGYIMEESPWESLPDDSKTDALIVHFCDVLEEIAGLASETEILTEKKRLSRKQVLENSVAIQRIIDKELERYENR